MIERVVHKRLKDSLARTLRQDASPLNPPQPLAVASLSHRKFQTFYSFTKQLKLLRVLPPFDTLCLYPLLTGF